MKTEGSEGGRDRGDLGPARGILCAVGIGTCIWIIAMLVYAFIAN